VARILIVDDEPDIRFMMRLIFEGAGHKVMEAGNGVTGMKCVKGTPPDLVTTDVMMPVMGGLKFIEWLRSDPTTAKIPILAVSANSELAIAADAVLRKPFLPRELLIAAAHLIRENGG
jgi:CheY-like chemotaxis protein